MISVVLPSYNRADLLPEALDRVLTQTLTPAEIIVIDDGSRDATREVLETYGSRVTAITIVNSGELVARNTGLRTATGDLVAFCDSDDLWEANHLELMAQFWAEGAGPLCAYADFREVRDGQWAEITKFDSAPLGYWDDLTSIDDEHGWFSRPLITKLLAFQPFFPSSMVVDRARFLALGGWDEGVSRMVGCDFATTLRIAEHPPIGVLRRATVGIRKHAGNFSGDVQRMNLGDADVLEYVLHSRPALKIYDDAIRRSIEFRRLAAFDTAFTRGDFIGLGGIIAKLGSPRLSRRRQMKQIVAALPGALRAPIWSMLTRFSSPAPAPCKTDSASSHP